MKVLEKASVAGKHAPNAYATFYGDDFMEAGYRDYLNTVPFVNILENNDTYQINVAVPGMRKDDFHITLIGNSITVSCEKRSEEQREMIRFAKSEFNYSCFSRSFTIPDYVIGDKLVSNYQDGILRVNLPKRLNYSSLQQN